MTGLSPRAARMAEAMRNWPRRRITAAELWRLLDTADPANRSAPGRRRLLATTLAELADAALLILPATRSYDRSAQPALPRFVTLPRPAEQPVGTPRPVWHPDLAWAAGLPLSQAQLTILDQANSWLFRSTDKLIVPSRERSWEIFGDEKTLDTLLGGALFGPGRLTLELLRTRRTVLPLHREQVGDGEVLLVVENSDTFGSIVDTLTGRAGRAGRAGRVGQVGWGAGAGFESSVLSLARRTPPPREIRYFGDVDAVGLRIPASASRIAESAGLPPVRPAVGLYRALFARGRPQPGQRPVPADLAETIAAWLPEPHWAAAGSLLASGHRLAQEAVGLAYLRANAEWQDG